MQRLTEVSFHAQRLVLLELCNGIAEQRNNDVLHHSNTQEHSVTLSYQQDTTHNVIISNITQRHTYSPHTQYYSVKSKLYIEA